MKCRKFTCPSLRTGFSAADAAAILVLMEQPQRRQVKHRLQPVRHLISAIDATNPKRKMSPGKISEIKKTNKRRKELLAPKKGKTLHQLKQKCSSELIAEKETVSADKGYRSPQTLPVHIRAMSPSLPSNSEPVLTSSNPTRLSDYTAQYISNTSLHDIGIITFILDSCFIFGRKNHKRLWRAMSIT